MDNVYEIVRTGNKGTVSVGFFQYERSAIREAKEQNDRKINQRSDNNDRNR